VLADRSGLHRAHSGEIERGEVNVSIQTLHTLAQTLKVRLKDLIPDI
jgi:transcriptional regulator with XRE-family HTH domain